jgi:hypothetical protein
MSILTPETGQPYCSHVIVSFGIRPAPVQRPRAITNRNLKHRSSQLRHLYGRMSGLMIRSIMFRGLDRLRLWERQYEQVLVHSINA